MICLFYKHFVIIVFFYFLIKHRNVIWHDCCYLKDVFPTKTKTKNPTWRNNEMSTRKHNVPYLIFICAIASISGIVLGYDASVISGVIDPLTEHLSLTPAQSGWAVSNVILGCIVGAWGVGRFTDRFGRKATLIITAILFAISAIGSALANDLPGLLSTV
jgi:Na+/melibiose symporter-like transporter